LVRNLVEGVSTDPRPELRLGDTQAEPVEQRPEVRLGITPELLVPDESPGPGMGPKRRLHSLGSPQPLLGALDDELQAVSLFQAACARELLRDPRTLEVGGELGVDDVPAVSKEEQQTRARSGSAAMMTSADCEPLGSLMANNERDGGVSAGCMAA